ncbi:hypothetical protein INT48_009901 [Thamnidium elegans]|uniref:Transcription elongation regulator 1 n=1 Tax=Thamnidium elegans TaxID=101142 RepID=A0A8H7SK90_9FUNG|nr:hypothetical protein INT48_009901 [Thamnidium elegans]
MNPVLGQVPVYNAYGSVPALPLGWVENYTPTGQPYWFNTITNQSSWVYPMMTSKKIPGTNWLFVLTHDGYEFYYDRDSKTSVWEQPEELKEAMQELKKLEEEEKLKKEEEEKQKALEEEEEAKKALEEEEENKKRVLEEEKEQARQEVKRIKLDQAVDNAEDVEATEMTEEDIMWQLQQMAEEEVGMDREEEEEVQEEAQKEEEIKQVEKKPELSEQECIEKFYQLLKENNISPFAVYSVELPKLMLDPRFSLVPHNKQKNLFNKYCHELGEQIKKEKSQNTKKPENEFKELLESKVTTKMYWDDFRRKFKNDPRFKALSVTREKEALFKEHIRNNLNKKNPIEDYKNLLRHVKEIQKGIRWRDAKKLLEKYDVYHAIEDKDKREDLFRDYLDEL